MAKNGNEIDWRVDCDRINTGPESPDPVPRPGRPDHDRPGIIRNEVESIIDEIEREQEAELEIVKSSDEVKRTEGEEAVGLVMDFVIQVSAGVSTALIVDMLREREETSHIEVADDE